MNLPKFDSNLPKLSISENKNTGFIFLKDNDDIKTKNIFDVSYLKNSGLIQDNENEDDLERFLTTKPNSDDVLDQ